MTRARPWVETVVMRNGQEIQTAQLQIPADSQRIRTLMQDPWFLKSSECLAGRTNPGAMAML